MIHIYIFTYVYIYIYICIHAYIGGCESGKPDPVYSVDMHPLNVLATAGIDANVPPKGSVRVRRANIYVDICEYMCIHIYIYTYIYMYIYMYKYTCISTFF
jgi:hypothetical protein